MASRFRIFRRPIISTPENVKNIVKAAVALHNFLLYDNGYGTNGLLDTDNRPGDWRKEIQGYQGLVDITLAGSNNYTKDAKEVRDTLKDYFNSASGATSWQSDYIHYTLSYFDREYLSRP